MLVKSPATALFVAIAALAAAFAFSAPLQAQDETYVDLSVEVEASTVWTFTARNQGTAVAYGVTVDVELADQAIALKLGRERVHPAFKRKSGRTCSGNIPGGTCLSGVFTVGTLEPGETKSYTLAPKLAPGLPCCPNPIEDYWGVPARAVIKNTAPVEEERFKGNNTETKWIRANGANGVYEASAAELEYWLEVSVDDLLPDAGGTVTFTFEVKRTGLRGGSIDYAKLRLKLDNGMGTPTVTSPLSGTTFDAAKGLTRTWDWDFDLTHPLWSRILEVSTTLDNPLPAGVTRSDLCLTAEFTAERPAIITPRDNSAEICLREDPVTLFQTGETYLLSLYDCVGETDYPCSSSDSLELLVNGDDAALAAGIVRLKPIMRPEKVVIHVPDPGGRVVDGSDLTWQTISDLGDDHASYCSDITEGVLLGENWDSMLAAGTKSNGESTIWSNVTDRLTATGIGGGAKPGTLKIENTECSFEFANADPGEFTSSPYPVGGASGAGTLNVVYVFGEMGTYFTERRYKATHNNGTAITTDDVEYTGAGSYIFHVGPVADLEVKAAWDLPGVFTLTALNHGPFDAPAVRVAVTPPPGLRFVRSEANVGSYDPATGVWDIGEMLSDAGYRQALGLPEATLTIHTEPRRGDRSVVNAPNQEITASIENTEDYCVRIKTGDASPDNDLECTGSLPTGYTEHSTEYYDYRPDNSRVALPADSTGVSFPDTRLTSLSITSAGSWRPEDDIEVTATFNRAVTIAGRPRLRLRVGEETREAGLHSQSGSTVVFRYRVREGDSPADGISVPPGPFLLPVGTSITGPGGGRVLLLFAGSPTVYPVAAEPVAGSSAPAWSPAAALVTGVEGARYKDFDGMRHYYRWNETTRRWEIEFRIADASLDAPSQNLVQWLVLRTSGYYVARPHIYGAAAVEMKPYLGDWGYDRERYQQQLCTGLKAEFSPGKTRGERLGELEGVTIEWLDAHDDDGVRQKQSVESLLRSARRTAAEATCPDPPTGVVTVQGQSSTKGPLDAVLEDPNGVNRDSVRWQWKRSPEGTTAQNVGYTGFSDITGATGSSYAPVDEDAGRWLRVKATYRDGQRQTRTAWGQIEGPAPGATEEQQERQAPPVTVADIAPQTVAADWPLIPEGLGVGDSFRLLFVTSATTSAESGDIAVYNAFVRAAAGGNDSLKPFKDQFSALISTGSVNIRGNTATVEAGVPIHWMGGDKVADDYADLYDLSWDSVSGTTETGGSYTGLVWTGSNGRGETSLRSYAGAAQVRMADLGDARPLSSPTAKASSESYPLYALSPVVTVAGAVNVDRAGVVSLGTETLRAGSALTATLSDPDGVTAGSVAWQWQRSPDGTTAQNVDSVEFDDISGATSAAYTPVAQDVGRWLRVKAAYADGHGPGKAAQGRTTGPVESEIQEAPPVQQQQQQAAAAVTGLAMQSGGPYAAGDAVSVAVAFSRDVTVAGAPTLSIELGGTRRTATYDAARSSPAAPVFNYTVSEGDVDADGVSVYPGSIILPAGASITDSGGNDAGLTIAGLPPQPGHTVDAPADTTAPAIVSGPVIVSDPDAAGPDDDTYGRGDVIRVAITFDEAVTVTGEPRLRLRLGERNRWARYERSEGSGTKLAFAYAVRGSDRDADGVSIGADQLELNGGTIADAKGNAAVLSHPALADRLGHRVDGSLEAEPAQQQQAANNEPRFASGSANLSVDEEAAVGANVGSPVTATDADGDAMTYALSGSSAFAIDAGSGQITVRGALDHETRSSYSLTVTVTDGKNASGGADDGVDDTIAVTVSVGNVDEPGAVSFDVDTPQADSPITASLRDPDGGVSGVSWSWQASSGGTSWTAIDGASGASYTPTAGYVGKYLRATAGYADGHGSGKSAAAATASAVAAAPAAQQQQAVPTVAADSPLVPTGLGPGDSFRLLFVTSSTTAATSGDIAVYNAFVRAAAGGNDSLKPFKDQFSALVSTSGVNIKDNSATTETGVPIHWLGGEQVADDYADLYDLSWDSVSAVTETGGAYAGLVWTGGNGRGETSLRSYAGAAQVRMGDLSDATRPLSSPTTRAATESHPLYALSPIITVAQPE